MQEDVGLTQPGTDDVEGEAEGEAGGGVGAGRGRGGGGDAVMRRMRLKGMEWNKVLVLEVAQLLEGEGDAEDERLQGTLRQAEGHGEVVAVDRHGEGEGMPAQAGGGARGERKGR